MAAYKPSNLPPITELAARVRAGETMHALAAEYGVAFVSLQGRFYQAGFAATGETQRDRDRRVVASAIADALVRFWEPWMEDARCSETDPEAFFPEKGGSTREAKRVCFGCDVRTDCLEWALANGERFGIFGGTSERERRKIQKQRKSAA